MVQKSEAFSKRGELDATLIMYFYLVHYDLLSFYTNSLPKDLAKIKKKLNKLHSHNEMKIRCENVHGINSMVCEPFKAFEGVVQEQILLFEEPVLACVELVIQELSNAVGAVLSGRVCTITLQFTF